MKKVSHLISSRTTVSGHYISAKTDDPTAIKTTYTQPPAAGMATYNDQRCGGYIYIYIFDLPYLPYNIHPLNNVMTRIE